MNIDTQTGYHKNWLKVKTCFSNKNGFVAAFFKVDNEIG